MPYYSLLFLYYPLPSLTIPLLFPTIPFLFPTIPCYSLLSPIIPLLGTYVRSKLINDKTKSIFASVLEAGKAYVRYHPILSEKESTYVDFSSTVGKAFLASVRPTLIYPALPSQSGATPKTSSDSDNDNDKDKDKDSDNTEVVEKLSKDFLNTIIVKIPLSTAGYSTAKAVLKYARSAKKTRVSLIHSFTAPPPPTTTTTAGTSCTVDATTSDTVCVSEPDPREVCALLEFARIRFSKSDSVCAFECLVVLDRIYDGLSRKEQPYDIAVGISSLYEEEEFLNDYRAYVGDERNIMNAVKLVKNRHYDFMAALGESGVTSTTTTSSSSSSGSISSNSVTPDTVVVLNNARLLLASTTTTRY